MAGTWGLVAKPVQILVDWEVGLNSNSPGDPVLRGPSTPYLPRLGLPVPKFPQPSKAIPSAEEREAVGDNS